MDESCTHCGKMTISELRSRLQLLQRGGVPVPLPRSNPPQRVAASGDTGDLRITVSAFPSGNQPPRNPHSSCTPQPAELPEERGGPSQRCAPYVSFGAPLDDRMSIAASEGESDFAGDDASAQLPPSGTVAVPDTDPEMMALVVQERHLWLCLADMRDTDKVRFLNSPVSQTGLFGDAVENFAKQFSAVQKQSEAISHILPRRSAVASTLPPAAPQPARRRGRPPATAPAPAPQQQPPPKRRRGASRKRGPLPVQAPAKRGGKAKSKRP